MPNSRRWRAKSHGFQPGRSRSITNAKYGGQKSRTSVPNRDTSSVLTRHLSDISSHSSFSSPEDSEEEELQDDDDNMVLSGLPFGQPSATPGADTISDIASESDAQDTGITGESVGDALDQVNNSLAATSEEVLNVVFSQYVDDRFSSGGNDIFTINGNELGAELVCTMGSRYTTTASTRGPALFQWM